LKSVLRRTVANKYDDLVTRHTGRAVRSGIEQMLAHVDGSQAAVIDFGAVGCLDISCADEIVGKLLRNDGEARYFVLRGVTEAHCEAISLVLERHGMAVVAKDREGRLQLLGPLEETLRKAFAIVQAGPAGAAEVAERLDLSADVTRRALDELLQHRLVQQVADQYSPLQG
jgi:hypothetical protein